MKRIFVCMFALVFFFQAGMTALARETDYVVDSQGQRIAMPKAYLVKDVITYLGEEGSNLYEPKDLFIDQEDYIYVADSGNNRIVKLDPEGNYVRSFSAGGTLSNPQGVFASSFGTIFVADTGNQRIVHMDEQDQVLETFVKPDSELLEDSSDFSIHKICVSSQGLIYVIKGQQFMTIDANNEFKGFVGANSLSFSLKRTLIRMFATQEQKNRLEMEEAPPFNNFVIADSGMIYGVAATDSARIKKLNAGGANLFPADYTEEPVYDEEGFRKAPVYVDIAVDSQEMISVLEQNTGHICQYDQEGNLLSIFGGKGSKKGYFQNPGSLAVNSRGEILVLDTSTGYIHIFAPTTFMEHIAGAICSYRDGEYEEALKEWEAVIATDTNYPVANMGMGQVLYKLDRPQEAMEYFELARVQNRYGKAFSDYRYAYIKAHFFQVVVLGALVAAAAVAFLFFALKKTRLYIHDYHYGPKGGGER